MGETTGLYEDIESLKGGPYFRLLTLLPGPADEDDIIECQVEKHPLHNCPPFEALSYCWRDPNQSSSISCNGRVFKVTTNLLSALRQMRGRDAARVLWVDAVCIDQSNKKERTSQVLLMRGIYQQAERVLVWLGPAADESDMVFPLCERLVLQATIDGQDGGEDDDSDSDSDGTPLAPGEATAVSALLSRPWWRRVWVVQEFCLAQSITFMCGANSLEWDILEAAVKALIDNNTSILTLTSMWAILSIIRLRREVQDPSHTTDILDLLLEFRCFYATNPCDKVYGLLGLVTPSADASDHTDTIAFIRPDYEITTEECYRQAALAILSHSGNLDVLSAAATTRVLKRKNLPLSLPSWVPDWSDLLDYPPNIADLAKRQEQADQEPEEMAMFDASRTAEQRLPPPEVRDGHILVLSGAVVDTVARVAEVLELDTGTLDPRADEAMELKMTSISHLAGLSRTAWYLSRRIGHFSGTFLDWKAMALRHPPETTAYRTRDAQRDAFFATVTRGGSGMAIGENRRIPLRAASCLRPLRLLGLHRVAPQLYRGLMGILTVADLALDDESVDLVLVGEKAAGCRLAVTEKGYLALVPAECRPTDSIALLKGGKVPYVIRQKGLQCELVGDSYVHGIMHGQSWKEDKCVMMEFV